MAKIILASGSPRRQELLQRMGISDFEIRKPDIDETYPAGLNPTQTVEFIARKKCDAVAAQCNPSSIVSAADTMVFVDGERLGKPADEADALRMLMQLQGRKHLVCTGVSVKQSAVQYTESESTEVIFRPASPAELLQYIHTGEPMDKAGAYGVQGRGALLVEAIHGDFFNVMGLPMLRLSRILSRFGVNCFN